MRYYQAKEDSYYQNTRVDVLKLLPSKNAKKVLEVGAGGCDTLCYLKKYKMASHVTGVELFKMEGSNQSNPLIDKFIQANIETDALPLERKSFDTIILADILEHLEDPWASLTKISSFLKDNGVLIVSLPNIRHFQVLKNLLFKGDFSYQDQGIMDKTHLRFFCKRNMIELFNECELKVVLSKSNLRVQKAGKIRTLVNQLSFGIFEEFLSEQFLFLLRKK